MSKALKLVAYEFAANVTGSFALAFGAAHQTLTVLAVAAASDLGVKVDTTKAPASKVAN